MRGNNVYAAINQLLEADVVYVRDFTRPDAADLEQMKHLAIVAHHCYRSFDLTMNRIYHPAGEGPVRSPSPGRAIFELIQSGGS